MESSIELVENTQAPETILNEQLQSKLLLIEHDNYLSKALSLNVAQSDYQISKISSEENISSALGKYLLEQTPDMIVFDIGLAGGTKLHTIGEIRMLYRGLLVIVSSQNNEQEQVDALKLGVDDFMPKPVDSRILILRIAALFRRQNNKF
ncbi:MAG: response regulator transcription factor [Alteromonadales bacterium]|nr:response regulator transcription factor [Alteromonadales bacterium]